MKNDDMQEAETPAIPPIMGVLGAAFAQFEQHVDRNTPEVAKKAHVEIPREPPDINPTKSMLDILSERIGSDINKRLTEFGDKNGFPVVFVFYQTVKNEDGVSKATCDIEMFKSDEKQYARLFALKHAGEFGIFDPRSKDEIINDFNKKIQKLEDDRDYWYRKSMGRDDGDTLGIFRHWDD